MLGVRQEEGGGQGDTSFPTQGQPSLGCHRQATSQVNKQEETDPGRVWMVDGSLAGFLPH